jgi:hypothetical protein
VPALVLVPLEVLPLEVPVPLVAVKPVEPVELVEPVLPLVPAVVPVPEVPVLDRLLPAVEAPELVPMRWVGGPLQAAKARTTNAAERTFVTGDMPSM